MGNEASGAQPVVQSRVLEQAKRGGGRRGRRRNQICTTILNENVSSVNTFGSKLVENLSSPSKAFASPSFDQFVAALEKSNEQVAAALTASSKSLEKNFESFVSSVMEDMEQIGITGNAKPQSSSEQPTSQQPQETKAEEDPFKSIEEFETVRVLGKGKGTKVKLVKNKLTQRFYAMKRQKYNFEDRKQLEHIYNEGKILPDLDFPFIIKTYALFDKGVDKKYFCMDFIRGGDLWRRLDAADGPIPEQEAIFYIAELLLAVEYIHSKGIAYRDIKLENIMIDQEGHVKLIDFGFAKKMRDADRTYTICGTPDYMAPEIVTLATLTDAKDAVGYDKMVDWWAIGVLFYELIAGLPPFPEDLEDKMRAIANCEYSPPKKASKEAVDFIGSLLIRDPAQRLGFHGASEVKRHPLFKNINWDKLMRKEVTPPYLPPVKPLEDKEDECSEGSYSF